VGGEPEKLLTLQEAARRLGLPADDVGVMIREGSLPSFRLAGNLLRLKLRDVERLRLDSLHALCSCLHGGVVVVVVAHAHKEQDPLSVEGRADAMRMTRLYAGFELELNT